MTVPISYNVRPTSVVQCWWGHVVVVAPATLQPSVRATGLSFSVSLQVAAIAKVIARVRQLSKTESES